MGPGGEFKRIVHTWPNMEKDVEEIAWKSTVNSETV